MAFMYKFVERDDALDKAMGGDSFFALAQANNNVFAKILKIFLAYKEEYSKHTVVEEGVHYVSMLELFNNLLGNGDVALNDENIAAELFTGTSAATARTITGEMSAGTFLTRLNSAIDATAESFRVNLEALRNSFKETYRHKDIIALLSKTQVVTKPGLVKSRVFETAYILDRILDKKRFLATSLLLGIMHVARFQTHKDKDTLRPFYNQGSALFTLLTFSFTPAFSVEERSAWEKQALTFLKKALRDSTFSKEELYEGLLAKGMGEAWADQLATQLASKGAEGVRAEIATWEKRIAGYDKRLQSLKSDQIQYGWKMFGSCLGIDNELLPTTYAEASQMWGEFTDPGYRRVVSAGSPSPKGRLDILDTFDKALSTDSAWDKADFGSFGLTLKGSWIPTLPYVGPVARLVGWYTSSNHAGLTCSGCRTVHGSRVSLVRLWHRCSACKKVYCAHCASGMTIYAELGVGTVGAVSAMGAAGVVTAAGGWWMALGSIVATTAYSATVGWLAGTVTTRVTTGAVSYFKPRKCKSCGIPTEALA